MREQLVGSVRVEGCKVVKSVGWCGVIVIRKISLSFKERGVGAELASEGPV